MIYDDQYGYLVNEYAQLLQHIALKIQQDVPTQRRDTPGNIEKLLFWRIVNEAFEEIEPYASDATGVQFFQSAILDRRIEDGYSSCPAIRFGDSGEHRAVVGAVTTCLDNDIAAKAKPVTQSEKHIGSSVRRQIFSLRTERKFSHRAEDMAMCIDGAWRRRESRF